MANWTQHDYDPSKHNWHKGVIDGAPNEGYPKNYFFADTLRSVIIGFGSFFNNLFVVRYDENGEPIKKIQVPLKFGPRMKSHDYRVEQETGKKYYIPLPNLTYRIDSVAFAPDRYAGGGEDRGFYSNYFEKNGVDYLLANKFWSDVQPVPVDIHISMEGKVEHYSDANNILEQIITRFAPDAFFDLKEFWFINLRRSIKMKNDGCNIEMPTEFGEEDKREITVSFNFTVEAFFYKPIKDAYIIDQIITHCGVPNDEETYNQTLMGNYGKDNPFTDRYDLAYQFGTRIGRVSALKDDYPKYKADNGNFYVDYDYIELGDITNYPGGAKQIKSVSSISDSAQNQWNTIDQTLSGLGTLGSVCKYNSGDTKTTYWSVTGTESVFSGGVLNTTAIYNPPDEKSLKPDQIMALQNTIWEFSYNPSYVIKPGKMDKDKIIEPAVYGGLIVKKYNNLFGYGDWADDLGHFVGTKDIVVGNDYISAAPYVAGFKVTNNS